MAQTDYDKDAALSVLLDAVEVTPEGEVKRAEVRPEGAVR